MQGHIPYVPYLRAPYYVWVGRVPQLTSITAETRVEAPPTFPPTFLYTMSWEDPRPDMEVLTPHPLGCPHIIIIIITVIIIIIMVFVVFGIHSWLTWVSAISPACLYKETGWSISTRPTYVKTPQLGLVDEPAVLS
jgi:hypothetical protein